jgi:uncharacterized membrane protein YdjX (TVP38/TMEM64 family)
MDAQARRKLWITGAAMGSVLAVLFCLWKFSPLGEMFSAEHVEDTLEAISGRWWTPWLLAALFTPAAVVMFPRPILTLAAVAVFGFAEGFAISMAGVLASAMVFYLAGRRIDEKNLERWAGKRIPRIRKLLKKEGLMAVTVVGLLPVAPFAIEMLIFGALRVKPWQVLVGVFLAMLPGMLGTTVLGHELMNAVRNGQSVNRVVVGVTVLALCVLVYVTHRWWKRVQAQL